VVVDRGGPRAGPGFAVLFMLRIALGVAEGPSFGAAQTVQRVLPPADRPRVRRAVHRLVDRV
jgi:hypothetical protein